MIVEQRVYEIKPGAMHEFLKLYEQEGLSLQSEALGGLAGYFITEIGDLNCVVQLWRFDSFDERTKRRARCRPCRSGAHFWARWSRW